MWPHRQYVKSSEGMKKRQKITPAKNVSNSSILLPPPSTIFYERVATPHTGSGDPAPTSNVSKNNDYLMSKIRTNFRVMCVSWLLCFIEVI